MFTFWSSFKCIYCDAMWHPSWGGSLEHLCRKTPFARTQTGRAVIPQEGYTASIEILEDVHCVNIHRLWTLKYICIMSRFKYKSEHWLCASRRSSLRTKQPTHFLLQKETTLYHPGGVDSSAKTRLSTVSLQRRMLPSARGLCSASHWRAIVPWKRFTMSWEHCGFPGPKPLSEKTSYCIFYENWRATWDMILHSSRE